MTLSSAKISRRTFLFVSAGLVFSACRGRSWRQQIDPDRVLSDLRSSPVINQVRQGDVVFLHKDLEPMSQNGKDAFKIVQRALFSLELVKSDPVEFNFGVYGPSTTRAIKGLQDWAGVTPDHGRAGRCFESTTLQALEDALELKSNNRWHPPSGF